MPIEYTQLKDEPWPSHIHCCGADTGCMPFMRGMVQSRGKFASNEHGRWLAARLANRNWRMKVDYINIGSTPADEDCLGVGHALARKETEIYCRQLEREFPAGKFSVKGFDHDFGRYHEVVAWYGEELDVATNEAAFEAECGRGKWDEEALAELEAAGIRS